MFNILSVGDIIYLYALGKEIVVLNSYKVAHDLVDKRPIYAGRPTFQMVGELGGASLTYFSCQYNDRWRRYRKLSHPVLHKGVISRYWVEQQDAASALLRALLTAPENFHKDMRLCVDFSFLFANTVYQNSDSSMAGKVIMSTTYGVPVESAKNEVITISESFHVLI